MNPMEQTREALLKLSHDLGAEHRELAILGEGNTSASLDEAAPENGAAAGKEAADGRSFLVKASGSSLGSLQPDDVVACRSAPLLELLDQAQVPDDLVDKTLLNCRLDPQAKKPSVEALFHAYLLSLPGIRFVGHTHPIPVNAILCSPQAEELASRRIFPDEIVCCGSRSVFVPYTDPGLKLAQAIRDQTVAFLEKEGTPPRVILLKNHGIITLGASPEAVKAAMLMSAKAARIRLGAAILGGPIFLSDADVNRIANRPDEHYRQKALRL